MSERDGSDAESSQETHTFASLLRRALSVKGWTASRLARALNVSSSTVSKWQAGTRPSVETATKIEELLNRNSEVVVPGSLRSVLEREIAAFDQRTATARARTRLEVLPCPYQGLFVFGEEESAFFFGRERFEAMLAERALRDTFVAVIGPSGCGKSSLVFAGLLPAMRAEGWQIASLRPGTDPLRTLAAALVPLLDPQLSQVDRMLEAVKLAEALRSEALALGDVVGQVLETTGAERLLLVVDQFEELYTLGATPDDCRRFVDVLLDATASLSLERGRSLTVVVTLRADFLGQAMSYRPLADALRADLKLGPMNREELQDSIEKPAGQCGVRLEDGLTARLLDAVSAQPGYLPLLEFTLTLLWERQEAGRLTHAAYEHLGRVEQALSRFAEDVYERLGDDDKARAAKVFLQLVRPGEGTEDTRRRATRAEVGEKSWNLVRILAADRLVVTGQEEATGEPTLEIVHEALIAHWRRLRTWIETDRAFRSWQERLRETLRGWEASGRDEGGLLRGALLAEAGEWRAQRTGDLGPAEIHFIDVSVVAVERARMEAERARRRRVQVAIGALSIALVVIGVIAFIARRQRNEAQSRRLAASAATQLPVDPERSLLLALEGYGIRHTKEAEEVLRQATLESKVVAQHPQAKSVQDAVFSPNGKQVLTANSDGTVQIWDWRSRRDPIVLRGHVGEVYTAAFSPDGRMVVSGWSDGTIQVWDWGAGKLLAELPGARRVMRSVAFSSDGQAVLAAGDDERVRVWDWAHRRPSLEEPGFGSVIRSVAFRPDGQGFLTAGDDGIVRVWDFANPHNPLGLHVPPEVSAAGGASSPSKVMSADFSSDGQWVVGGLGDGTIRMWDWRRGGDPTIVGRHDGNVLSVAFSPNGRWIVSSGEDATVRVWERTTGREFLTLRGHEGRVKAAVFSLGGRYIVSAGDDGTVRVWDWAPTGDPMILHGHGKGVSSAAFDADGRLVVSGGADGTVRVWDWKAGKEERRFLLEYGWAALSVAFSRDGHRIVSAGADSNVRVWNWEASDIPLTISVPGQRIWSASFSGDGGRIVTGDAQGRVVVWDAAGRLRVTLRGHGPELRSAAFSPDGRFVVSCSDDGTVRVWDWMRSKQLKIQDDHRGPVFSVDFSPDGRWVVSSGQDGTVRVWEWASGKAPIVLWGHGGVVQSAAFSHDGQRIVSASWDATVRVWDWANRKQLAVLKGHQGPVFDAAFSPNDRRIVSAGADGSVRVWQCEVCGSIDGIRHLAEKRVTRGLTEEERATYLNN